MDPVTELLLKNFASAVGTAIGKELFGVVIDTNMALKSINRKLDKIIDQIDELRLDVKTADYKARSAKIVTKLELIRKMLEKRPSEKDLDDLIHFYGMGDNSIMAWAKLSILNITGVTIPSFPDIDAFHLDYTNYHTGILASYSDMLLTDKRLTLVEYMENLAGLLLAALKDIGNLGMLYKAGYEVLEKWGAAKGVDFHQRWLSDCPLDSDVVPILGEVFRLVVGDLIDLHAVAVSTNWKYIVSLVMRDDYRILENNAGEKASWVVAGEKELYMYNSAGSNYSGLDSSNKHHTWEMCRAYIGEKEGALCFRAMTSENEYLAGDRKTLNCGVIMLERNADRKKKSCAWDVLPFKHSRTDDTIKTLLGFVDSKKQALTGMALDKVASYIGIVNKINHWPADYGSYSQQFKVHIWRDRLYTGSFLNVEECLTSLNGKWKFCFKLDNLGIYRTGGKQHRKLAKNVVSGLVRLYVKNDRIRVYRSSSLFARDLVHDHSDPYLSNALIMQDDGVLALYRHDGDNIALIANTHSSDKWLGDRLDFIY